MMRLLCKASPNSGAFLPKIVKLKPLRLHFFTAEIRGGWGKGREGFSGSWFLQTDFLSAIHHHWQRPESWPLPDHGPDAPRCPPLPLKDRTLCLGPHSWYPPSLEGAIH